MRLVLLGADPVGVQLSRRAWERLCRLREEWAGLVDADRTVVLRDADGPRWWTLAGGRANAVLHAALAVVAPHPASAASPKALSVDD